MVELERRTRKLKAQIVTAFALVLAAALSVHAAAPGELSDLAKRGEFDALFEALKTQTKSQDGDRLIHDLDRYRKQRSEQIDERMKAYREAVEEVDEHLKADELSKALFSAAEAQSLAMDKDALKKEEPIKRLVEIAGKRAAESETKGLWLDALNLYRGLDALYEIEATYKDDLDRVTDHIRMLRVYTPDKLEELYLDRAKRLELDDDEIEPLDLDEEEWPNRLAKLEWSMMSESFERAARYHIDGNGYAPMLKGGFDSLLTFSKTEGLSDEFQGMKNMRDLATFRAAMETLKKELDNAGEIGTRKMQQYLAALRLANKETIKLPEEVIVYEMTQGATDTLDTYSTVIWPHEVAELFRTLQGNFPGVGILLNRNRKMLVVKSPLENGPAIRGGIRANDVIVAVDGKDAGNWTLTKAVEEITGPEGTEVTLTIERGHNILPISTDVADEDLVAPVLPDEKDQMEPDEKEELDIERFDVVLKRERIKIGSVLGWQRADNKGKWDFLVDKQWRIGYVRVSQFLPQTADDLDAALRQMTENGPINGLILDLRFNPGGLLRAAVQVSDRFIDEGTIVSTVDRNNIEQDKHTAKPHTTYPDFPVVVLVNQGSASASEIVSGALQDHGRATIVGKRSFGKGSVQDMFNLPNGKALLKLTTQYYRLPNKRIIHRKPKDKTWGIEPDLFIDVTDQQVIDQIRFRSELDVLHVPGDREDPDNPWPKAKEIFEKGLDPQLDAALLLLKTNKFAADLPAEKQARGAE